MHFLNALRILLTLSLWFSAGLQAQEEGRKLALLVGVGDFQNPTIPKLQAPSQDVDFMAQLLTHPHGYGFHADDLLILKDHQATLNNFRRSFQDHIIEKATRDDVVLIYFSGHGSQVVDRNGDEIDGKDETLVFFDSRTDNRCDFLDDEFYQLIQRIQAKHIVVILDACHSGSATKGDVASVKVLGAPNCSPDITIRNGTNSQGRNHDRAEEDVLPNLVVMSAVSHDASIAFEQGSKSQFTQALGAVLSRPDTTILTYEQLALQVRRHPMAHGQTPLFRGALNQNVFQTGARLRPLAYLVEQVSEEHVFATGMPMPGWSQGGTVWVYDVTATGSDFLNPDKAKIVMKIETAMINKITLKPIITSELCHISPGDFVLLRSPGDDLTQLEIKVRTGKTPFSFSSDEGSHLQDAIVNHPNLRNLVLPGSQDADWFLTQDKKNKAYVLSHKDGKTRHTFRKAENGLNKVIRCLWLHALQKHLVAMQDLPGKHHQNCSLDIQLIPTSNLATPSKVIEYLQEADLYEVRAGFEFRIRVEHLSPSACGPLRVGGVVLSGDGSIFGLPQTGEYTEIGPGEEVVLDTPFTAGKPFHSKDQILIFGTEPENAVHWHLFHHATSEVFLSRGMQNHRDIARIFLGTERNSIQVANAHITWLSSHLSMVVHP